MKKCFCFIVVIFVVCISCDVILHRPKNGHHCYGCVNTSANMVYLTSCSPPYHPNFRYSEEFHAVAPGTINTGLDPIPWGFTYESSYDYQDTILIYVFPFYRRDLLKLEGLELVCYRLTLEDLTSLDFLLSFPPDERMKDMAMDPPYESFL